MRIYVACFAGYNSGVLHGDWIDAKPEVDAIHGAIREMLEDSSVPDSEEYAIHDSEDFGAVRIGEYDSIEQVQALAVAIQKHGEAYSLFYDVVGIEHATPEDFQEAYLGEYDSEEAFAQDLWEQAGYLSQIPDNLQTYIDWERIARDLFMDGWTSNKDSSGNVHVFSY